MINQNKLFFDNLKWLNSKETAVYLRISENNLRVKIAQGLIPVGGRLGRSLRFKRDDLDKLLESHTKGFNND